MEKKCPICQRVCKNLLNHIRFSHPNEEATMAEQSQLNKLLSLTQKVGINGEKLLEELSQAIISRLPQLQPVDTAALIETVSLRVEARVGAKLSDVLEAVKASTDGSRPDTEGIIKGVAGLLQPQIIETTKQASEAVFAANSQSLLQQLEEKLKQQATPVATREQPIGSMTAGNFFQTLLANSEGIARLVQAFRPPPTPEVRAAELLGMSLRLADKIDKVKTGKAQIDELTKDISDSLQKK